MKFAKAFQYLIHLWNICCDISPWYHPWRVNICLGHSFIPSGNKASVEWMWSHMGSLLAHEVIVFEHYYKTQKQYLMHHYRICCLFWHDDVIKWKYFPYFWPFVRRIHQSPVDSPQEGQWRSALMFSLVCTWTNARANNWDAGDLRCHYTHYDVTVMSAGIQLNACIPVRGLAVWLAVMGRPV